jgi:hypothetical protein
VGIHTVFYSKKIAVLFLLLLGISIILFITFSVDKTNTTKISVTVKGTIKSGIERDRSVVATFLEVPQGTYYLVDDTDETSRKQKVTKNCPTEGTIDCYLNKQVRIEGTVTDGMKWIVPSYKDPPIQARELKVMKFDLLK